MDDEWSPALRGRNGSSWPVFTAEPVDGTKFCEWVNVAASDIVAAQGIRLPLTGIKPPS
jgi:hypothetical protein